MNDIAELNRKAWNKIAKEGRNVHASKGGKENALLTKFIDLLPKGGEVLDLGYGNGIPLGQQLHKNKFKITAVDVSDEMMEKYGKNVPGAVTLRVPMTEIEWKNKFDGIISSYSMLCLPPDDFKVVAKKAANALKAGGLLLLFLNEGDSQEGMVQEVQGQMMYSTGMSEAEIRNIFEPQGMKMIDIVRETDTTEEYGTEHSIYLLMKKE